MVQWGMEKKKQVDWDRGGGTLSMDIQITDEVISQGERKHAEP